MHEVLKSHFSVPYSLVVLVDARPVGFQSSVFWGLVSQVLFYFFIFGMQPCSLQNLCSPTRD